MKYFEMFCCICLLRHAALFFFCLFICFLLVRMRERTEWSQVRMLVDTAFLVVFCLFLFCVCVLLFFFSCTLARPGTTTISYVEDVHRTDKFLFRRHFGTNIFTPRDPATMQRFMAAKQEKFSVANQCLAENDSPPCRYPA